MNTHIKLHKKNLHVLCVFFVRVCLFAHDSSFHPLAFLYFCVSVCLSCHNFITLGNVGIDLKCPLMRLARLRDESDTSKNVIKKCSASQSQVVKNTRICWLLKKSYLD